MIDARSKAQFVELDAHERKNRTHWDGISDAYEARHAAQLGANAMAWGCWSVPESHLHVLGDVAGKNVLEFGCGAARWSIALAQRGAHPVGLDNSARQLQHARRNMRAAGLDFALLHASAESVPLADSSFDIVFCDHGAFTYGDPFRTIPEAARLLRAGGLLAFSASTPIFNVCWNEAEDRIDDRLHANYFEQHRFEDESSVNFSLPYGTWIALFRRSGFTVEDLIELRPPENASTTYDDYAPLEWARRWPAEQIWRVRKT